MRPHVPALVIASLFVACDPLVTVVREDNTVAECGKQSEGCTASYQCIADNCPYGTVPMKGGSREREHVRCLPAPKQEPKQEKTQ